MKKEKFNAIHNGIVSIVEETITNVRDKSFSDYVLLLARADFDKNLDRENVRQHGLLPYVIEDRRDMYMDMTRQRFLVDYLNDYQNCIYRESASEFAFSEKELNIQLMMYSHIWESQLFLKILERIANILSGKGYSWKCDVVSSGKKHTIDENILKPLHEDNHILGKLISLCYNGDIRNAFAHSAYSIESHTGDIIVFYKKLSHQQCIKLRDWEERFCCSILLSYHLPIILKKYKNEFIKEYGDGPVQILRPTINNSKRLQEDHIYPYYELSGNKQYVLFCSTPVNK